MFKISFLDDPLCCRIYKDYRQLVKSKGAFLVYKMLVFL